MLGPEGYAVSREGPIDVVCVVPGYRPARIDALAEDTEVRMDPLPSVPIRIVDDTDLGDDHNLRVILEPIDGGDDRFVLSDTLTVATPWLQSVYVAPGAVAATPYDGGGRYTVHVQGSSTGRERTVTPNTVVVGDSAGPLTVHVR